MEDGRRETATERLDRHWVEQLQELRVMQTGTQLIAGFLRVAGRVRRGGRPRG